MEKIKCMMEKKETRMIMLMLLGVLMLLAVVCMIKSLCRKKKKSSCLCEE